MSQGAFVGILPGVSLKVCPAVALPDPPSPAGTLLGAAPFRHRCQHCGQELGVQAQTDVAPLSEMAE